MNPDRTLAPSPFPDDTGEASERTRGLIAQCQNDPGPQSYLRAVASLCGGRILVPVVATATRLGDSPYGMFSDKEAEMAVVLIADPAGRRAMLAFTGLDSLREWDARARPVPVTLDVAAKSALADGATALLLDLAGPQPLVIEGEVLARLGAGHRLVELEDGFGWAMAADHA